MFITSEKLNSIANCYAELDRNEKAIEIYNKALKYDSEDYNIYQNIGLSYIDLGLNDKAYENFQTAYNLKYIQNYQNDKNYTTVYKIRHDIEQIEYLISQKVLDDDYQRTVDEYKKLEKNVNKAENFIYSLEENNSYDKNLYLYPEKTLETVINKDLDFKVIEKSYLSEKPETVFFDNFLSEEGLEELRNFCLRSTIWHEYERKRGYIASYMSNGFNSKIIYQLAEELKIKFPDIFKDYLLRNVWAFKYMDSSDGVLIHADEAMINVNFWITSDLANKDPNSGGMIIYDKEAPLNWQFSQYNQNTQHIEKYLADNNAQSKKIDYKANRAIIFNSGLFHQTDKFDFKSGYENHRINITLLFGKRI